MNEEGLLMGMEILLGGDKNVLEINSSDGYTTLCIYKPMTINQ